MTNDFVRFRWDDQGQKCNGLQPSVSDFMAAYVAKRHRPGGVPALLGSFPWGCTRFTANRKGPFSGYTGGSTYALLCFFPQKETMSSPS